MFLNGSFTMWTAILAVVLAISWYNLSSQEPQYLSAPRVSLPQGVIVGTILEDHYPAPIEGFLGVPYAQPPIGERRLRRAEPLPVSNATFEAVKFGDVCPGKLNPEENLEGADAPSSENCLLVNVYRQIPKVDGVKLPVAVYIHGGAFNRGNPIMHDTASMVAWSESPFIAVSFQYRLGALGFLPSKVTFDEGIVNLGLHDQIFLLQWVQDNIEHFGGDKDSVTIVGLSAGAHSVGYHLMNDDASIARLFHRAVPFSGGPTCRPPHSYSAPLHEEQFAAFVSRAGCGKVDAESIIPCFRTLRTSDLLNASFEVFDIYAPSGRWAFQPTIDGDLISERAIDSWASGRWNRVPILTGHNTNEGTYYVPSGLATSEEFRTFFQKLLPHYSTSDLDVIDDLYPDPAVSSDKTYLDGRNLEALNIGPQFKRVEAAYGQYAYVCPVRQTADLASGEVPVWLFHWATNITVKGGANHADNMYYETFQHATRSISESQRELSGLLHAYITSFITHGDPNAVRGRYSERPEWGSYKRESPKAMTFGKDNDERAGGDRKGVSVEMIDNAWIQKACDFWWRKAYSVEE